MKYSSAAILSSIVLLSTISISGDAPQAASGAQPIFGFRDAAAENAAEAFLNLLRDVLAFDLARLGQGPLAGPKGPSAPQRQVTVAAICERPDKRANRRTARYLPPP